MLCRTDAYGISKASLDDVVASRERDDRAVAFKVREQHQQNMKDLTQTPDAFLAVIMDDQVHSAPRLRDRIRSSAQITGGFSESDAKALAALLQSPALPVRLKLARR